MPVVAVVGAGIAGLAGALSLADSGVEVVVLEAEQRLGGKILTEDFGGLPVETGPDAFLARVPQAVELCRRLGLADQLVAPTTGEASLWVGGRMRRLPAGTVMGVPTQWGPLARSGVLSPLGLARAGLDLVLPATRASQDRSVSDLVRRRLGRQVAERLAGPLVGGINAGRADQLSAAAVAPALDAAARRSRSLVLGLRRPPDPASATPTPAGQPPATPAGQPPATPAGQPPATPAAPGRPVFLTHPAGLSSVVEAAAAALSGMPNADVRTGAPVTALRRRGKRWSLDTPHGEVEADGVMLAVPAFVAGTLLAPHAPDAASVLGQIDYASVALVTLAYPESSLASPLRGSGYLVPAGEGRLTTACTFTSRKWAQASWQEHAIFRISVGRMGDSRHRGLGDADLVSAVHGELVEALGLRGEPERSRVNRWPHAFPQYEVGHLARVAAIESAVADLGALRLAGAAYRGIGIPACIAGGQAAAAGVVGALAGRGEE